MGTFNGLSNKERLIWLILFDDEKHYELDLTLYCKVENRAIFRNEIREIVKKGNKVIVEDRIIHKEEKTIWKIELKLIDDSK